MPRASCLDRLADTLPHVHWSPLTPPDRDNPPYDEMLEHGVSWCPELQVVLVAAHDLVRTVLTDPNSYSSANAIGPGLTNGHLPAVAKVLACLPPQPTLLINADGADHRRMRSIYTRAFSRSRVRTRIGLMQRHATAIVEELRPAGSAELHKQFALRYLTAPVNDLFGFPPDDAMLIDLYCAAVHVLLARAEPEAAQVRAAELLVEAYERVECLLAKRAAERPDDRIAADRDLVCDMVHGGPNHELSSAERIYNTIISRIAAEETTRYLLVSTVNVMIRSGLWTTAHAASAPERTKIVEDSIVETLRIRTPHRGLMRVTTIAVQLGPYELPQGTPLLFCAGAANRDPRVFPNPNRVDITRPNAGEHLAFGAGPHRCVGEYLARTEVRIAIEALMTGLPDLHLLEPSRRTYVASPFFAGLQTLLVGWNAD